MAAGTPIAVFPKDPDAVLDFGIDWAKWLGDDIISTSTWTVPAGINKQTDYVSGSGTIIWLSGGTAGTNYDLVNRIVTVNNRTEDRTIRIAVAER